MVVDVCVNQYDSFGPSVGLDNEHQLYGLGEDQCVTCVLEVICGGLPRLSLE